MKTLVDLLKNIAFIEISLYNYRQVAECGTKWGEVPHI
jgi:hypothetical protein